MPRTERGTRNIREYCRRIARLAKKHGFTLTEMTPIQRQTLKKFRTRKFRNHSKRKLRKGEEET